MSRWDYDTVFYKVFCITLLAVAFTFTVILTNVFVDIDGLLSKKDKVKPQNPSSESLSHDLSELSRAIDVNMLPEDKSEDVYEDKDYQDSNDLYRSKRSLDAQDRLFHIKDPQVKLLLTNHLANLLDELDEQNNNTNNKKKSDNRIKSNKMSNNENKSSKKEKDNFSNKINDTKNKTENLNTNKSKAEEKVVEIRGILKENIKETKINGKVNKVNKDYKAELLNLGMRNFILQGLVDNTNLDDIYKKVTNLVKDFENDNTKLDKNEFKNLFKNVQTSEKRIENSNEKTMEDEFKNINETLRQINLETQTSTKNEETTTENNFIQRTTTGKPKDHNVIIKTIIDITAMPNDRTNKENDFFMGIKLVEAVEKAIARFKTKIVANKQNERCQAENNIEKMRGIYPAMGNGKNKINGIIKLIYNGNIIKFKRIDDENTNSQSISNKLELKSTTIVPQNVNYFDGNHENKLQLSNQSFYQNVFYDYLKRFKGADSTEQEKVFASKRLKRHIKIRYENEKTTVKPKTKKDDDELFVEIETHFDSKGTKGEKKKKLISNLIKKIQNAIHSDNNANKKKQKQWHVKKRIQNPLSSKSAAALINKLIVPLETLAHRHLDPIGRGMQFHEDVPLDNKRWEKPYRPGFFSKHINSAEMNTVDTDYKKVMKHNGIPQRLQKPLNTDISDEVFQDSRIVDLGNLKFFIKDIDGTGFSIGFNQYADEAPDPETMKLFSGLQNIIQTYHQEYDQESTFGTAHNTYDDAQNTLPDVNDNGEQLDESNQHVIERRSILGSNENDHHPNRYKLVYSHNFHKFKKLTRKPNILKHKNIGSMKGRHKSTFLIDENVFEKKLKPAEIFSIANLFERKKRAVKVKKISNVKLKSNVNRYLNTKKMAAKSVFRKNKKNKRQKRQIEKIRIIARDLPQHEKSEEENIFLVSDENVFGERALVREVELPEMEPDEKAHSIEHYDFISPPKEEDPTYFSQSQKLTKDNEDQFDMISPYLYQVNPFENNNEFRRRARHNSLMSKYPHIIMEDAPNEVNQGEEFFANNIPEQQFIIEATTAPAVPTVVDLSLPNEQEISELISPPTDHSNSYRMSVKIRPKNSTNMSGFKEVHTSINKIYNKNGLTYTSLVNISQLSKLEKLNKTLTKKDNKEHVPEQKVNTKNHENVIKNLIQQHKQRLETHLKHLQLEKQKLDDLLNENSDITEKILEKEHFTTNSKKGQKPNQDDVKKKMNQKTITEIVTTQPTTTVKTPTTDAPKANENNLKTKMIATIERNENITNELLKRIDQNTGVLKIFLSKLIAKIDVPTLKTNTKHNEVQPNINVESTTSNAVDTTTDAQNIGRNRGPFNFEDFHYMPNMLFRNKPANNSYGIPFVYAVQQPFNTIPNKDSVASVIYHGHIHSNTVNGDNVEKRDMKSQTVKVVLQDKIKIVTDKKNADADFWKPKPGEKVLHDFVFNKNNSRFFLDDTRNDFTVAPLSSLEKTMFALGSVNGTKL